MEGVRAILNELRIANFPELLMSSLKIQGIIFHFFGFNVYREIQNENKGPYEGILLQVGGYQFQSFLGSLRRHT